MGEAEKQKSIRALFPSIAGMWQQGGTGRAAHPAGRLRDLVGDGRAPPRVVGSDDWG